MTEPALLAAASAGEALTPRDETERTRWVEWLREAEGRAAEFDHLARANAFRRAYTQLLPTQKA